MDVLTPKPLSQEVFKEFGEVIELENGRHFSINYGLTTKYQDLATIDTSKNNGHTQVNLFHTRPVAMPHRVRILERHPLGSQLFMPMDDYPFLVLVSRPAGEITFQDLVLFITNGKQAVNLYRNTWHHYHLVLRESRFIVIDRGGEGENLEEMNFYQDVQLHVPVFSSGLEGAFIHGKFNP